MLKVEETRHGCYIAKAAPLRCCLVLTVLLGGAVGRGPAAVPPDGRAQLVLKLFRQVSAVSRPSGEEKPLRDLIAKLRDATPPAWKAQVRSESDAGGNLKLTLPATGRYAGRRLPPIILQSHMDMVLVTRDAATGAALKARFANGVAVVQDGHLLHSKDYETSLGADDGIGNAMALRYLVDPAVEHPPLQLLFTSSEEMNTGLPDMTLTLNAPVLINLDSGPAGDLIYGCLGYRKGFATTTLLAAPVPPELVQLQIKVMGLRGGHSGTDIHRPRLSAIRVAAAVLLDLAGEHTSLRLLSAQSGGKTTMSAIQTAFEMVVAIPAHRQDAVTAQVRSRVAELVNATADESLKDVRIAVQRRPAASGSTPALSAEQIRRICTTVLSIPHGVVTKGDDPPHTNGLKTATNVGWLDVHSRSTGSLAVGVGYYVRSYYNAELDRVLKTNADLLKQLAENPQVVRHEMVPGATPWLSDTKSWLMRAVRAALPGYRLRLIPAGLETRDYSQRVPALQMVSMAPTMNDCHSPRESLDIDSVGPSVAALDAMIAAIAGAREYQRWVAP